MIIVRHCSYRMAQPGCVGVTFRRLIGRSREGPFPHFRLFTTHGGPAADSDRGILEKPAHDRRNNGDGIAGPYTKGLTRVDGSGAAPITGSTTMDGNVLTVAERRGIAHPVGDRVIAEISVRLHSRQACSLPGSGRDADPGIKDPAEFKHAEEEEDEERQHKDELGDRLRAIIRDPPQPASHHATSLLNSPPEPGSAFDHRAPLAASSRAVVTASRALPRTPAKELP